MSNINASVGKKIRHIRKANNYTQGELGDLVDFDPSYIGRIERGEINVTLDTLSKISDALRVKPSQLLETTSSGTSDKLKAETLNKIDHLLFSLDSSDLQIVYRLLKEALAFKKT